MVSPNRRHKGGVAARQIKAPSQSSKSRKRKRQEDYHQVEDDIQFLVTSKKPKLDIEEAEAEASDVKPTLKDVKNKVAAKTQIKKPLVKKLSEDNREVNRRSPNGFLLPDPLPRGEVLTDTINQDWVLGKAIGVGGFGELYLASYRSKDGKTSSEKFVIKVG